MCISLVHVDQNLNICPIKIVDPAVISILYTGENPDQL
jgi:hypothetical protein